MNICIVSDYLPKYHKIWSGAEVIASFLSEILEQIRYETFFITTRFNKKELKGEKIFQVSTPFIKLGMFSRNFPIDFIAYWSIFTILKKYKPDIVHINAKYLFLPTIKACNTLKIPAVFTVPDYFIICPRGWILKTSGENCTDYHGESCYECLLSTKKNIRFVPTFFLKKSLKLRATLFNYYLEKIGAYIVLTETSRRRLRDYGIPQEKIHVIYHYRLKEPYINKEVKEVINPAIFFIGWISEHKGINVLIEAFSEIHKEFNEAMLYIVGVGEDNFVKRLKGRINQMNLNQNIKFLGKRKNEEVLGLISQSDIVVVPEQWNNEFGPVILVEALGLGKPVVASKIGATSEFIKDGKNGFLVEDYRNPLAFAEKIKILLTDKVRAAKMGEFAKNTVAFLSDGSTEKKIINLYNELAARRNIEIVN